MIAPSRLLLIASTLASALVVLAGCGAARAPGLQPNETVDEAFARATALEKERRYEEATLLLSQLTGPDADPDLLQRVGHRHRQSGRRGIARRLFERALEDGLESYRLFLDLADDAMERRDFAAALRYYERALETAGSDADAAEVAEVRIGRARALHVVGRSAEALAAFEGLRDGSSMSFRARVAIELVDVFELDAAERTLQPVPLEGAAEPLVVAAHGRLLAARERWKDAVAAFETWLDEAETVVDELPLGFHLARTDVALVAGDVDAAEDALDDWETRSWYEYAVRGTRTVHFDLLDGEPESAVDRSSRRGQVDHTDPKTHLLSGYAFALRGEPGDQFQADIAMGHTLELKLGVTEGERRWALRVAAQMRQLFVEKPQREQLDRMWPWVEHLELYGRRAP